MKNLVPCIVVAGLLLAGAAASAQTTQPVEVKKEAPPAKKDRGSEGAITMEEYQTLLAEYQKANPGKTFQNMKKEEFETYLTTELTKLRKKRAEEAMKQSQQKKEETK